MQTSRTPVTQGEPRKKFRISPSAGGHFARLGRLRSGSAKTYGNPARGTASRKTCDVLVPSRASLIGRFSAFPEKEG